MAITPFHARYRGRSAVNLAYSLLLRVEDGTVTDRDRVFAVVAKQLRPTTGIEKMRKWLGYRR